VNAGESVTRPEPDPYKADYTFEGWYGEETLNTVYDFTSPVNENIRVWAKWAAAGGDGSETGDDTDTSGGGQSATVPSTNPFEMTYESMQNNGTGTGLVDLTTYEFNTSGQRVADSDIEAHFTSKLGTDESLTGVSGARNIPSATFKFHNTANINLNFWFIPDEDNLLATRRTNADGSSLGTDESKWGDTGFSGSIPANGDIYITIAPRKAVAVTGGYTNKTFKIYWSLDGTSFTEASTANRQITAPYKFQWELLMTLSSGPF
jgi:uncharacterized repeat protein (TIGR02543 family)